MIFNSDSADFLGSEVEEQDGNQLLRYLQIQSPEILAQVAHAVSSEAKQIISHNVQGLLGVLPGDSFNVKVSTDRDNLANLLVSAMMTGYFLRQMENRMELEDRFCATPSLYTEE
jgi:hypothetical protein